MSSLSNAFNRLPKWGQVTVVVIAGAGSFLLAALPQVDVGRIGDEIRPTKSVARPARKDDAPASAAVPIDTQVVAATGSEEKLLRLNSKVVRNPFGALNTSASLDVPMPANPPPVVVVAPPPPPPKPVPPPVVQQAEPVAPTAPPLPFKVIGSIRGKSIAQGNVVVFLADGNTNLAVKEGDEIGGKYRVTAVSKSSIEFLYIPLSQKQALNLDK